MCRSQADGGRRCNGGARTATPGGAEGAAKDNNKGTAPSRARTDELAAALPADRTGFDGQPLSEDARRLYALREAGYKGPIDQDGYPVTEGREADILRHMATQRGEHVDW